MVIGFVPLFFATSTFVSVGYEALRRENAERFGRSVAARVSAARSQLPRRAFLDELHAQVESGAAHAIGVYHPSGEVDARVGQPTLVDELAEPRNPPDEALTLDLQTASGPAVLTYLPDRAGGVATITRVEPVAPRATQLSRIMGLYMSVGALMVLVVAYFALTRWIVRPIMNLERAADRIASGGRRMEPIRKAPRELQRLSRSLTQMTRTLVEEEEALRRKIEEVESATRQLEETHRSLIRSERMASVGRLSAGLAHEVGNPISSLMGLLDLMMEGDLSPAEQRDFLERMKKETARIDRVISDLLTYARPAKADMQTANSSMGSTEPGRIEETVDDVLSLLRPQRDMKEVTFRRDIEAGLPPVPLSQSELTQVLLNLLMNAADACERRGSVVVTARRIDDDSDAVGSDLNRAGSDAVEIAIEDDGPGVDPSVRDSLFEPFVSTKEVGKGTGLGLSVTRGLIEAAGGNIRLDAAVEQGARFVITFPLETARGGSEPPTPPPSRG